MKKLIPWIFSAFLVIMLAVPLSAQEATCDDIAFDEQALAAYPMVRQACLDIVEVEGVRYAHLAALVHREGFPSMLLRFKHQDGSWGPATLVTPAPGFKVYLDGQAVPVKDVPRGRELSVYLPEGRWEVVMSDADEMYIAEAEFAAVELVVTEEVLAEEVDMEAAVVDAAVVEDAGEVAADDAYQAADDAEEASEEAPAGDSSEWLWILGLAGAFIIVWLLLRKRKARREG